MTKEEKNNVTRLSALCSITTIYIQGCKKTIEEANTKVLREQYKYDTLSLPNKKVVDKRIKEAIKNLPGPAASAFAGSTGPDVSSSAAFPGFGGNNDAAFSGFGSTRVAGCVRAGSGILVV